jgi:asparagine synthase (glutamine-hydrolysing)
MGGITGLIDPILARKDIRPIVRAMTNALEHRGPDDQGFFVADGVAIGMRRLRVHDLAGGRQPISNEDGSVQVVLSGEIFNDEELREDLARRGHRFATRTDTEVIAHLYEEKGLDCLADLHGTFALAIWDRPRRRLALARDRLGKQPLFFATVGHRLLFGSEIKAILAADPSLADPDPTAIIPYLRYGRVPDPRTMFRRIRQLRAAHWMTFEDAVVRTGSYWTLPAPRGDRFAAHERSRALEALDAALEHAVRARLRSDAPMGVFLSGGLDSSLVAAYATQTQGAPLRTFTIGFDRPEWDESADAAQVARHLGADHHVLPVTRGDLDRALPATLLAVIRHMDEPVGDAAALIAFVASKAIREHATVVLSGDGGNELFAGHRGLPSIAFAELYRRLPETLAHQVLPTALETASRPLPMRARQLGLEAGTRLREASLPFELLYLGRQPMAPDHMLRRALEPDVAGKMAESSWCDFPADLAAAAQAGTPALARAAYAGFRLGLLDSLFVRVDRMSMAHSLEVRTPLLDHTLVELAAGLPASLKIGAWRTKGILRDLAARHLPHEVAGTRRRKFAVPLRDWLRTGLREMAEDYLAPSSSWLKSSVIQPQAVASMMRSHRRGEADHSQAIWLLLTYAAWAGMYPAAAASRVDRDRPIYMSTHRPHQATVVPIARAR